MTDFASIALNLEYYIREYVPKGWKESIENVMFVPWVSVVDLKKILEERIPDKFNRFPFTEAIENWCEGMDG